MNFIIKGKAILGRQAKILTPSQIRAIFAYLDGTRHPNRNRVMFLLSVRAGLRAKEIALLTWSMVTDGEGRVADVIRLTDEASKGRSGGIVPMAQELKFELEKLQREAMSPSGMLRVIQTRRRPATSAQVVVNMFRDWYRALGFEGCSSHSGRRTFITRAARNIGRFGGSIRDVQVLARHSSLSMTQRYIEVDAEAMRKVVDA